MAVRKKAKSAPKKAPAKKANSRKAAAKATAPKKARAAEAVKKKPVKKEAVPKKAVPKKAVAKKIAVKKAPVRKAAPARAAAKAPLKKALRKAPWKPSPAAPPVTAPIQTRAKASLRPLEGLVALDLTRLLPGPAATLMLANFGAQVIKIEDPRKGDPARSAPPLIHDRGALFSIVNRGKKSIALNLRDARGKEAFLRLVKKADIVIEGFRPGVMKRLGLDYEKLRRHNKRLIYAALTGYGQQGPYAKSVGHDVNYLALGGALELLSGEDGVPMIPGFQIADMAAGALPAVIGVLLALNARHRTGHGQMVDVAMLDGVIGLLPVPLAVYAALRRKPLRGRDLLFGQYACYNIYPARNGRYLAVGALEPKFWAALCQALEREDLIKDQFAEGDRQQVLIAELTRSFQRKEVKDWLEEFEGKDVCVTEVRNIAHVAGDEHLIEREMIVPVRHPDGGAYPHIGVYPKLSDTPGELGGAAPERGEHTREVLRQAGLSVKRIDEMLKAGVIEQA